jgi:sarcosine oxidase subunit gamma
VAELIATSATEGLVPVSHGRFTLADAGLARITSVAPFNGGEPAVTAALGTALGLGFPAPNTTQASGAARIVWTGRGQAFLMNADPTGLEGLAALTDQTDAWAALRLAGAGADQVLARLVPLDLRPAVFAEGAAARSALGHMMAVIWREGDGFVILVMRSMARTAVHEIAAAMSAVAARS